jgi:hypothetical protein
MLLLNMRDASILAAQLYMVLLHMKKSVTNAWYAVDIVQHMFQENQIR